MHARSSYIEENVSNAFDLDIDAANVGRRFRPTRLLLAILAVGFVVFIGLAFASAQIDWPVVGQYVFARITFVGLGLTILMSCLAMALGVVVAVLVAVGLGSDNPVIGVICRVYAWLFRGTPQLLQLLIWYNLALVFPVIGIPGVWKVETVSMVTPLAAAFVGLGLNSGAYMSEIIRSGLLSVDIGQYEAAKAIGMTRSKALRKIIFPQAMRVIIPPLGNEFIGMTKNTSLASVIGFGEIMFVMQSVYFYNFKVIEMLMVSAFWYLILTTALSLLQGLLERRFGRAFKKDGRQ